MVIPSYCTELEFGSPAVLLAFFREVSYAALGEEIFFPRLVGGWSTRRFGFYAGNTLQTLALLLPHLLLLLVGMDLRSLLPLPLLAGWLLGRLRYRSGSILPSWLLTADQHPCASRRYEPIAISA